ncbi:hypothetical protein V8J82_01200 [Gymnodinialimonas sp. 2305UL16-5]|uniref:hypothetical protein n=1 Tax=Gymnodinialimonas mytili TaxID=3126503 RepID=UPI0030A69F96
MFKHTLLAALGLCAALGSAQADTIIVERPTERPNIQVLPNIYANPAFERMVEMCAQLGVACGTPGDAAIGPFGTSPRALADAQKRMDLYAEELEAFAEDYADARESFTERHGQLGALFPMIRIVPPALPLRPHSYALPHGYGDLYHFGHRFPGGPRLTLPRSHVPQSFGFPRGPLIPWPTL